MSDFTQPNWEHFPFAEGMPMIPLYGFDHIDDAQKDYNYFLQLQPNAAKLILAEVQEECDKLEYEGSCMYDEYPDKGRMDLIASSIYERISPVIPQAQQPLEINSLLHTQSCRGRNCPPPPRPPHCPGGFCPPPGPSHPCGGRNCPPPRPDFRPNGRPDWLKILIDSLLYQEFGNRRRRYRSRNPYR